MLCPKCGAEMSDQNDFCTKCGSKISADEIPGIDQNNDQKQGTKEKSFSLPLVISIFALLLIALSTMVASLLQSPVTKFESAIKEAAYTDAAVIYMKHISGDPKKVDKVNTILSSQASEIRESFINEKIEYNDAKEKLEGLISIGARTHDLKQAYSDITNLNDSRNSFADACAYSDSKDYFNAIKAYKKVIKEDSNYAISQEYITQFKQKYKEQVLKDAEDKANSNDYFGALQILTDAAEVLSQDPDISAKISVYQKADAEKKANDLQNAINDAKNNQKVIVISADIAIQSDYDKSSYPDMLHAIVQNNSNKTVTTYYISFLAFDENGSPIDIKPDSTEFDPNIELIGRADSINILPSDTYGDNIGWTLAQSHGIKTVLACVKEVYFDDGSAWTNPYYEYFIDEYKDKPLH